MKSRWIAVAASLLAYTIITIIIGRDVLAHLGSMIVSDAGDPMLTAAILKWNATHVPLTDAWYQFPIFFPTRDTITFSEHLLGLSVIASPIYWLTGDIVVTYNLILLLTFPLCGIAMYALVHRLTGSAAAAFVAGIAFAFAPYRISQLPHIQMLASFWAPLALLGLHAWLETGRRRWLVLYGATWMLQGASNGYALVMFSLLVGLWTLWFVVWKRRWRSLMDIAAASLIAIVPLAPVLYRYATVHSAFGFARGYNEIRDFSADIAGLLCAPHTLQFWGWLRVWCRSEGELFPGAALTLLVSLGLAGLIARAWRAPSIPSGRLVTWLRRILLFAAAVYTAVIVVLLVSGPFMFDLGPLRVQASTLRKPVQVITITLLLALVLSPGVRAMARESRVMGFYILAAVVTWVLTLGPVMTLMGNEGFRGPYHYLMALPGLDSLRVPARFWLMTTICVSVVAGLVVSEFLRGRSRRVTAIAVAVLGLAVLGDGWNDRIGVAALPAPVPGAASLAGATVFAIPPDLNVRDTAAVFWAVDGGWNTVNGYSGWWPSYYFPLIGAARAEVVDVMTPFQEFGELNVLVSHPRLREVIERQPGVTEVASDGSTVLYRLPKRKTSALPRPQGQRLQPRVLRSECSTGLLKHALDNDESTLWQCALWDDPRGFLTIDLGDVQTVGSVVNNLGVYAYLYPGALHAETSTDGVMWSQAWSGSVRERSIRAAIADPRHLRIVLAFPPRQARFIRLRAEQGAPEVPWAIAELEVWSSSTETR